MAKFLEVSRSNFYHFIHRKPSKRAIENAEYLKRIKSIHESSRCIYGSPRIHAELKKEGVICSRRRIAKIMRAYGIQAKMYKLWKKTTIAEVPRFSAKISQRKQLIINFLCLYFFYFSW